MSEQACERHSRPPGNGGPSLLAAVQRDLRSGRHRLEVGQGKRPRSFYETGHRQLPIRETDGLRCLVAGIVRIGRVDRRKDGRDRLGPELPDEGLAPEKPTLHGEGQAVAPIIGRRQTAQRRRLATAEETSPDETGRSR